jgi:CRISPR-associated protein Cst1
MAKDAQQTGKIKQVSGLGFTGNWFIDAGILGFANLMEDVYEWDLNKLQNLASNNFPKLLYWFFPIGYLFYHSTIRAIQKEIQNIRESIFKENGLNQKIRKIEQEIKIIQNRITKINNIEEKKKLEKRLSKLKKTLPQLQEKKNVTLSKIDELRKKLTEEKRKFREKVISVEGFFNLKENEIKSFLPNFKLNLPAIARNFYLFNSKEVRNNPFLAFRYLQLLCQGSYEELYNFIKEKMPKTKKAKEGLTYEICPDSTINPFLYSPVEFSNIGYTNPLKTIEIKKSLEMGLPVFISLLCFEHAFENYYEENVVRNIFFYTNNLEVCYSINKRMRIKKEKALSKSKYRSLLKITFESVIDELVESKADFSLEDMYLIEYKTIENQKLINVEYIGIPKLQASILLDDTIRYNLNNRIQFKSKNFNNNDCWLLEELVKGRPLYPIILNHISLVLNENEETHLRWNPSLYSLITDAKILELRRKNKGKFLFSNDFFDTYKSLTNEVKKDIRYTSFSTSLISKISKDIDKKRRIARELFGALKERNKNIFLNTLLKYMNEEKKICSNKNLNGWIFEKIIKNDITYEMYCLILIMNLLKGR